MRQRILNSALLLSSMFGYLEWGGDNRMFLFQGEAEVLSKLLQDPLSAAHPFTLLPLFGQIVLLITIFQRVPSRLLTFVGLGCLSILLVFMFLIGIISTNFRILLSTVPFLIIGVLVVKEARKK